MHLSLRTKILLFFGISNILLLAASLIYGAVVARAEAEGVDAVICICKSNLSIYCPGCGGSRSLLYLLRFDFLKSFIYFPALILCAIIILDVDVRAVISFIKNDSAALEKFNLNILISIPAVIILNFLIRNILLFFGIDYIGDVL